MRKNVMVVDDEPSILFALRKLLELEGYQVTTANSGKECIDALGKGFKGVILMDIMMPGMDGWDTVREIVNQGFIDGNIISMLTARDRPDQKMEGLQEYVIDYITKPFDPDDLVNILEEYLTYLE
ncbi:MAG: response regulator [Chloroflexota bacterium]|nr:response regulator [Chloroflexota bacterium]